MRKIFISFIVLVVGINCNNSSAQETPNILKYKDIPGVTQEEIDSIEALKNDGRIFSYAMVFSTEAFLNEKGQVSGYTAGFSRLLSQLFDMQFVPYLHGWDDLVAGLANKRIDFSGEFSLTPERKKEYMMSEAISMRSIAFYYPSDRPLDKIVKDRIPTLGFLGESVQLDQFSTVYKGKFKSVFINRLEDAPAALAQKKIDAFVNDNACGPIFDDYDGYVVCEILSPLICDAVGLTTQNNDYWAIISVFDKYIKNGGRAKLSSLYVEGMTDYTRSALRKKFNAQEKAYIDSHIAANEKIPVILESGNYPICFYNQTIKEYQGIVPDLLSQVTKLTGLQFESINKPEEDWATVLSKVQSGKAALISELLHTSSREGQFLWPKNPSCITRYALLSKSDAVNLEVYQMLGKRIGVEIDTAYEDVAKRWFPDNELLTYSSIDDTFDALDKGEIDLIMASENLLLSQTNYSEKPGYKVNFSIDYTAESKLGFNINETMLLTIFDKTHPFTANDTIVRNWINRVFDYSSQMAQVRVMWLFISTLLLIAFIVLLGTFLFKNSRHRRSLSSIVQSRTTQLEEKTATLFTIYNAIPDLLYSKDKQGKYTSCNPSFEAYVGLPSSEIIGKYAAEIFNRIDSSLIDLENDQDMRVINSNTSLVVEQLVTYPNGEQRLLETIKTPLSQNGVVNGMIGLSRNITAHKTAQEAAFAASKAKGSFLARMSHEIRTPLNAIIGMAEITKASIGNTEKTISSVNQIIVSSHHLLSLINDVLDMSKIESGNLEVLNRPFNLRKALEETLTIISSRCEEKNITFEHNVDSFSNMVIVGDKLRLNQVLINLLSNAAKFTDVNGRIEFTAIIVSETTDDITIRFIVEDNGIGMSQEQISRLFKPFEQADGSIASRFGGTGLGLSISHNLVQIMGGNISLTSEMHKGSEFSFELVLKKGELLQQSVVEQDYILDFKGFRILLVEDIEVNRLIVQELLAPYNLIIETAENGHEALDLFIRSDPEYYNLIIMDIQMPVMDGYEATTIIRALPRKDAKDIPIIAMSANAYKEDVEQSLAVGMNGHIGKPIDIDEMIKILATYLNNHGDKG